MKSSRGESSAKKTGAMQQAVPIPNNRNGAATPQLSAPVRDLADLIAQIAAEAIMKSIPKRTCQGEGEHTND
ncbi:hypothetical protein [Hydrogenophaga atypica]|uniref:Uncharacterized protein n=1 Tax=Hydrogenophaga atypica TaxID=249409 RepID=A0ABW2QUK6_9BURK